MCISRLLGPMTWGKSEHCCTLCLFACARLRSLAWCFARLHCTPSHFHDHLSMRLSDIVNWDWNRDWDLDITHRIHVRHQSQLSAFPSHLFKETFYTQNTREPPSPALSVLKGTMLPGRLNSEVKRVRTRGTTQSGVGVHLRSTKPSGLFILNGRNDLPFEKKTHHFHLTRPLTHTSTLF